MRWQVREAGQRFSEVLRAAEGGEPPGFMDYLMSGPLLDEDLNPGRGNELPRDIDLVG